MIENKELMTNTDLISWARTLSDGYAKPDQSPNPSGTGTVRETKNFMPFIMLINKKLCENAGIECPDVKQFSSFKTIDRERVERIRR